MTNFVFHTVFFLKNGQREGGKKSIKAQHEKNGNKLSYHRVLLIILIGLTNFVKSAPPCSLLFVFHLQKIKVFNKYFTLGKAKNYKDIKRHSILRNRFIYKKCKIWKRGERYF